MQMRMERPPWVAEVIYLSLGARGALSAPLHYVPDSAPRAFTDKSINSVRDRRLRPARDPGRSEGEGVVAVRAEVSRAVGEQHQYPAAGADQGLDTPGAGVRTDRC